MTGRKIRKPRSERRVRMEAEYLESRNLLSQADGIATAQLVFVPLDAKRTPAIVTADLDAKRAADVKVAPADDTGLIMNSKSSGGDFHTSLSGPAWSAPQQKVHSADFDTSLLGPKWSAPQLKYDFVTFVPQEG
jgi:hypothetical protein